MKATTNKLNSNMFTLNFYNSKEVYDIKYFDTLRKLNNYVKKYSVEVTNDNKAIEVIDYNFSK